ncbi:hypothetical protein WR25_15034 [Diploscapter pachys]|uniref:Atg6 BARA domain-containing protein n=1 Tax=Diploscapter pachys TaxID=2018661 RepID=A0A2A2LKB3_9BILA|nr:hypothetical protein WR25_15034 [Diploscapter pachys]
MSSPTSSAFICLNCQGALKLDPSLVNRKHDRESNSRKSPSETEIAESLSGQSRNLLRLICDAEVPSDAPICKECSEALLSGMDSQLKSLEEECVAHLQLIEDLKKQFSDANISAHQQTLYDLQRQDKDMESQLAALLREEKEVDDEIINKRNRLENIQEEEKKLWADFRDNHSEILKTDEEMKSIEAQIRYADAQHSRLAALNALDLCFHIWVDMDTPAIAEINGFRLGRLPDRLVDWTEINAAWGQCVLLLEVLMERMGFKQDTYILVAMGSHSSIKVKKHTGEITICPLHGSGSWNPFGNNNVDSGIVAFLQCLEILQTALRAADPKFEPAYAIRKDRLVQNGMEFSVKMMLNGEERWTKAMKLLLSNLKLAVARVSALRTPS